VSLEAKDIMEVCRRVMMLGRIANWQFKGLPVMQWEFADISDYHRARKDLMIAMAPELRGMVRDADRLFRRVSDDVEELDCYGVTFRLICKQKMMTRSGPYGAADLR
jgi:hypothetical protein